MGIYALGTCNKSPKIETKTILQKLLSVVLPYKLQTSRVSASTHGHLSQDCPSSSLTSRTVPFSSEPQMSLPHKDLYSLSDLHPPAFQNGNDPSFPSSPPLLCLLSFLPSLPFPFFLPTPFPTQLPIGEHGADSSSYPCVMLMTVGASCDMINKLKSFWRTENWQLEGMRANPGDIFLYHWPTGNLFSVHRMSAIWQSEMLTVRYFRTLPCLLWKHHTFTESRCLYLENLMLWHSLRLWEESLSWELSGWGWPLGMSVGDVLIVSHLWMAPSPEAGGPELCKPGERVTNASIKVACFLTFLWIVGMLWVPAWGPVLDSSDWWTCHLEL